MYIWTFDILWKDWVALLNLCILETPKGYFGKQLRPDEMLQNVVFHQGLHCMLR